MTSPILTPPPPGPQRVPDLWHFLLFLGITFVSLLICEAGLAALHPHDILATLQDQRLQLYANIVCYLIAIGIAIGFFPLLWHRSFAAGISWNRQQARWFLIPGGIALGFVSQGLSSLLPIPKKLPIEQIFETPGIIWILTVFGVLIAPLFEEIVFRGLLLPGIALCVDYLRLPRSLEALTLWRASDAFSQTALIASSIITSLLFALIHAPQLGFTWSAVSLLVCVSLILCYIRVRFRSVAASTVVHVCYNLSVFLTLFISTGGYRHLDKI